MQSERESARFKSKEKIPLGGASGQVDVCPLGLNEKFPVSSCLLGRRSAELSAPASYTFHHLEGSL